MGLIAKIKYRVGYVWWWRAKYWWLDTREGAVTRWSLVVMCVLGVIVQTVRAAVTAAAPAPGQPRQAVVWFIVWAIVALVVGLAIALSASSKPAKPPDSGPKGPTTQDGQSVKRHYGTVWVPDAGMAAFKVMGRDPIVTKGGKK